MVDHSDQAGGNAAEDHRTFDVNRAMSALKSPDASVRRKAIMRFHVRWWHATTTELTNALRTANAPACAIADIPAIVQSCSVCREWHNPGPRNIATFRLVLEFNE